MGLFHEIDLKVKITGQIKTGDLDNDDRLGNQFKTELKLLCIRYGLEIEEE